MGRWFADFLLKDGKEVIITGRNEEKLLEAGRQIGIKTATSNLEAVKDADYILLSVPIESFKDVVKQISPQVHAGQAIIDITSTKVLPVAVMHKHIQACPVLGAHTLFGPSARSIANQNFVLTPTRDDERALAQKIKDYLEARDDVVALITPGKTMK